MDDPFVEPFVVFTNRLCGFGASNTPLNVGMPTRSFKDVRVLELSKAVSAFCGWEDNTMNQNFDDLVREPMRKKWEFKYMETGQEGIPNYKYWVPYDQFEWMNGFEDMKDLVDSPNWPECKK